MKTRKSPVLFETVSKIRTIIDQSSCVKLPSVRELAVQCSVSPLTVLRAIGILKNEGLVKGEWGRANYIDRGENVLPDRNRVNKAAGIAQNAVLSIRKDIVDGKYPVHLPLPSIKQLTSRYSVSYPTIKKALGILVQKRVIKRNGSRYYLFT
ncbi:MAG: GntR family transcriptional regulator, partial [Fibrobacter sp.]|nr:GntR family transcriptional regulator [Fibrobacter sp.]